MVVLHVDSSWVQMQECRNFYHVRIHVLTHTSTYGTDLLPISHHWLSVCFAYTGEAHNYVVHKPTDTHNCACISEKDVDFKDERPIFL